MRLKISVHREGVFQIHTKNNLTTENYFEDTGHLSVSKFKRLMRCENQGLSEWGNPTPSMLVGSYVDAHVEGTLEQFKEEHPEIISTRGATKGQLKTEFKQANEIIDFIDNDENLQNFLSGEKQRIMTGEIKGTPWKIMMDSYDEGVSIVDLKVMRSITNSDGSYYDFISAWGYDIQLAVYQEIVRQNTGKQLPVYIAVVTKESPINSAIVHIDQHTLDLAMVLVETHTERFYDLMTGKLFPIGCGTCKTCISRRNKTPIISLDELRNLI